MTLDSFRDVCRSFPNVSENVQWGEDLVFKVGPRRGGKMFAVVCLDPSQRYRCSFKCSPEDFVELQEREGIAPAPYLARAQWVAIERFDALGDAELRKLLKRAYEIVAAKAPKRFTGASRNRRPRAAAAARRR